MVMFWAKADFNARKLKTLCKKQHISRAKTKNLTTSEGVKSKGAGEISVTL
jgi:hypothetical protein